MGRDIQARRERWKAFWGRRSRVEKITLVLLAIIFVCTFGLMVGWLPTLDTTLISLSSIALAPLLLILLFRWLVYRVLWKVRNRLILTYVLMGLAPVVMFATLAALAAYFLAGQYATDVGMEKLNQALQRVRDQAGAAIVYGSHVPKPAVVNPAKKSGTARKGGTDVQGGIDAKGETTQASDMTVTADEDATPLTVMQLKDGVWARLDAADAGGPKTPLMDVAPPAWLHPGSMGIVEYKGLLYLCVEVSAPRDGRTVVALGSRALNQEELDGMAKGLGRIILAQGFSHLASDAGDSDDDAGVKDIHVGKDVNVRLESPEALEKGEGVNKGDSADDGDEHFGMVKSAPLAPVRHAYLNPPVFFTAVLPVKAWTTGDSLSGMMAVFSRPTLLYTLLFASSVKMGKVVWGIFIGVAIFFAMLEFFALAMATTLSWSITRSVSELYKGTRAIDAGHLEHRIPVKRKDQLAALATSFNGMASSVSELLVQQREKERLLNELAIAQEVQSTLFPKSPAMMGNLEVHGTCIPARTVGGDYFDFIFGYGPGYGPDGGSGGHVTLALGDISGKGISAALLMSALHSADRAFSAAVQDGGAPSPATLLKLLNTHLYRSTQSARYATLFLASYDPTTRRLTYSNGGHLPPLVISADGSVQKLEVGGAVVGLLDGLDYDEATVQLQTGDLFVAFTDGLTEPEKDGEDFGEQRLMELVRAHRTEPLTTLAANTLQTVKRWIGEQEQPDDMTIVLARQG
ncbi:MAG: SpoIIE family protein phosphatase [Acidobacteriaceae bacterium]